MKYILHCACICAVMAVNGSCKTEQPIGKIKLITLDPGHFHAALVQKSMYPEVDDVVSVYAPDSPDVKQHLAKIDTYNNRPDKRTHWNEKVYLGHDFFEKMLSEKAGNVVVLAGNNQKKTEYILKSIENGFNVYSDKPMAINPEDFEILKKAFAEAKNKKVLLYDIMTERYEISTVLQKALSNYPQLFGTLEKGTLENPAVTKESVHHFFKYVSGAPLIRPAWFFDVEQEGEGIVDVTTHLVDLVMWECFPDQVIDTTNVHMLAAKRWPTVLSKADFKQATGLEEYPGYLSKYINGEALEVFSNGEMNYTLNDVHVKVSVSWNFQAPKGTTDTHFSIMRGTKANLVIRQGAEQQYQPTLYIEPIMEMSDDQVKMVVADLAKSYPGVGVERAGEVYKVLIPEAFKEGHEAHFARVTEKYLGYLKQGKIPAWEAPNMIAKYYTIMQALEMARK